MRWFKWVTVMRLSAIGLSAVLVTPMGLAAQLNCGGQAVSVEAATPTERFSVPDPHSVSDPLSNLVTDNVTGLMWMRCPWGYNIDALSRSCQADSGVAVPRMGWKDAILKAEDPAGDGSHSQFGQSGWRVPNIKELASIIEHGCSAPSINSEIFPGTPDEKYWTSSPLTQGDSISEAWTVDFQLGVTAKENAKYAGGGFDPISGVQFRDPVVRHLVRFVRDAN